MDIFEQSLQAHRKLRGKLSVENKDPLETREALSLFYTPGVAAVSRHLHEHPEEARDFTGTNNSVAIVSDGSAVLGLGNIGPYGALPVMEGKAMLFKKFGNIDGYPIVLNTQDPDEIIAAVKAIAPSFGGINLEDIAAPQCFYIEEALKKALPIPVMHDDQHGTAVVVLAGLINAFKLKAVTIVDQRIVIAGSGAAGIAIAKLLYAYGARNIVMVDSKGIISSHRKDLNESKQAVLDYNKYDTPGTLEDAMHGADVFIGVAKADLLKESHIKNMAIDPIVFAMANPIPEIMPDAAIRGGALVVATGRSDFPNQINNVLAFPGLFRGALDNKVATITTQHKLAAAKVLASIVGTPSPDCIIPSVLDESIVPAIAKVVV